MTMISSRESRIGLSSPESEGLEQYRSLSVAAVFALLLGLLSVVALAHPAAWVIPAVAAVVSLWAIRRIGTRADTLQGTGLAVAGLILSLFFLGWGPTSYFGDRWLIRREARQFGRQWIEAVLAGQTEKAHQATLMVRERQPEGTSLVDYYAEHPLLQAERDAYFDDGLPRQLLALQGEATCVYRGNIGITYDRSYTLTSPRFLVFRRGENEPALYLQLDVTREEDDRGVYWTVAGVSDAAEADRRLEALRGRS